MLKKILKSLLGHSHKRYSSSDYHRRPSYKRYSSSDRHAHRHHGHGYYKKKHKSSFLSSFFSS
ncbi:hypothetical protein MUG87_02045 [Ectobacillus sp. JY-23]|uniref:hypothetical protein n=1 Tax=Ectobacillus sp. JY-23 TaxID=2933872 RepID=UPI001FF4E11E|nr:hypothetical protein [Ectobacillus sp. JY-23]UOY92945.1 hypothetical protein MUG87_02045 [Ectobacillus sp. JY-23]